MTNLESPADIFEPLIFQESKQLLIAQKKSIFHLYAFNDELPSRKQRSHFCTKQNFQGFLQVLEIQHENLFFFDLELLSNQIHSLMSTSKFLKKNINELIQIKESQMLIILKGTFQQSWIIDSLLSLKRYFRIEEKNKNCKKKRERVQRNSRMFRQCQNQNMIQNVFKTEYDTPQSFKYVPNKQNKYSCLSQVQYFCFQTIFIEKLQDYLNAFVKKELTKFISACLGVEKSERMSKALQFFHKNIYENKQILQFNFNKIYLIYRGGLLLSFNKKKLYLGKYGMVFRKEGVQKVGQIKERNTIILSIQFQKLVEYFQQDDQVLQIIEEKLRQNRLYRENAVKDFHLNFEQVKKEPIMNFSAFNDGKRNSSNRKTNYFHVSPQNQKNKQNTVKIEDKSCVFMQNYYFQKLFDSLKEVQLKKQQFQKMNQIQKENKQPFFEPNLTKPRLKKKNCYLFPKQKLYKMKTLKPESNLFITDFTYENDDKSTIDCENLPNFIQFPVDGQAERKKYKSQRNFICETEPNFDEQNQYQQVNKVYHKLVKNRKTVKSRNSSKKHKVLSNNENKNNMSLQSQDDMLIIKCLKQIQKEGENEKFQDWEQTNLQQSLMKSQLLKNSVLKHYAFKSPTKRRLMKKNQNIRGLYSRSIQKQI